MKIWKPRQLCSRKLAVVVETMENCLIAFASWRVYRHQIDGDCRLQFSSLATISSWSVSVRQQYLSHFVPWVSVVLQAFPSCDPSLNSQTVLILCWLTCATDCWGHSSFRPPTEVVLPCSAFASNTHSSYVWRCPCQLYTSNLEECNALRTFS